MKNAKSRRQRVLVILLLLVILALAGIAGLLAARLYRRFDPRLAGSWQMQADLTETARARANAWLRRAEHGEAVDAADYLPRLCVTVRLTLSEDGTWTRQIDSGDYDTALTAAQQGLSKALTELLRLRIEDAGRPPETAQQAAARLAEAIGMSAEQYLQGYGPALLPGLEELHAFYDGAGRYSVEGQHLRFDGEALRYLADDGLLVLMLPERTEVYERA